MNKKVEDYMSEVTTVTLDTDMLSVLKLMIQKQIHDIVVTDANDKIKGIITGSDILLEIERELQSSRLREGIAAVVMTPDPEPLTKGEAMVDAASKLFRKRTYALVVVDGHKPVGLLTHLDVAKWWAEEFGQPGRSKA